MTTVTDHWTWEKLTPKAPPPTPAPRPRVKPSALDALAALVHGTDDVATIANRLLAGGWTGHKAEPEGCPIARYLHDLTGWDVAVDPDSITVWSDDDNLGCEVATPARVAQFVRMFDAGCFPGLIS